MDGKPDTTKVAEIELCSLAEEFRYQKLIFETARKLFEEETPAWRGWCCDVSHGPSDILDILTKHARHV